MGHEIRLQMHGICQPVIFIQGETQHPPSDGPMDGRLHDKHQRKHRLDG